MTIPTDRGILEAMGKAATHAELESVAAKFIATVNSIEAISDGHERRIVRTIAYIDGAYGMTAHLLPTSK